MTSAVFLLLDAKGWPTALDPEVLTAALEGHLEAPLAAHDSTRFEIYCYSNVQIPDPVTQKFRKAARHWVDISGMTDDEQARVKSQYASVELADGANTTAMAAIGSIRGNAQNVQTQIANLEQDSLSADPNLNTEVSVLNKINAAGVLTLRTLQDSNKLLASLLEQQTIIAKQQREATTNAINTDISRRANLAGNMAQMNGTLTESLQTFRMP